jgi:hypothetical protein
MFLHNLHTNMNIYMFATLTVLLSLRISTNVWCVVRVFCYIACAALRNAIFICPLTPSPLQRSLLSVDLPVVSLISRGLTNNHPSSFTSSLTDRNVIPSFCSVSVVSLAELFIWTVRRFPRITGTYQPMSGSR